MQLDSSINSIESGAKLVGEDEAEATAEGEEEGEIAAAARGSARRMTPF